MPQATNSLDVSLAGLGLADWKSGLAAIADKSGFSRQLGKRHFATFIDESSTLLVTFETSQGIRALSENALPLGFDLVRAQGWSHLCLISDGDTWFRDASIYEFFDQLIDDGFFEDFDRILFYGAGPCGYAAAAFSVAAPGATVLVIQPQATLDPRVSEWDDRFAEMRRLCFTDRYGYAPDMLDAAGQAFVLYDPRQDLDAMHSALFNKDHVSRFRLPNMGGTLQTSLIEMRLLHKLLALAGTAKLTDKTFYRLYRARRDHLPYLRNLMARLDKDDRPSLNTWLCKNVVSRLQSDKFSQRLEKLENHASAAIIDIPSRKA